MALGVKGAVEADTVGVMPAVINSVNDALAPLGIGDIQMPATPERLWRTIRRTSASGALPRSFRPSARPRQ